MKQFFAFIAVLGLLPAFAMAQEGTPLRSANELADLVAPIALYPDDLVAVVLPASAYPLQLVQARRLLDDGGRPDEAWDEAVVAVMNYPEVMAFLNEDLDWTYSLGLAFIYQEAETLEAIQNFRSQALAAGNLQSDDYQIVEVEDGVIRILARAEDTIYIPYYEPKRVVVRHVVPVYYYHPIPRPVYYYPYPAAYAFNVGYFYGVGTYFSLGWHYSGLNLFYATRIGHPYWGRYYAPNHYYYRPRVRPPHYAGGRGHHYKPGKYAPVRHPGQRYRRSDDRRDGSKYSGNGYRERDARRHDRQHDDARNESGRQNRSDNQPSYRAGNRDGRQSVRDNSRRERDGLLNNIRRGEHRGNETADTNRQTANASGHQETVNRSASAVNPRLRGTAPIWQQSREQNPAINNERPWHHRVNGRQLAQAGADNNDGNRASINQRPQASAGRPTNQGIPQARSSAATVRRPGAERVASASPPAANSPAPQIRRDSRPSANTAARQRQSVAAPPVRRAPEAEVQRRIPTAAPARQRKPAAATVARQAQAASSQPRVRPQPQPAEQAPRQSVPRPAATSRERQQPARAIRSGGNRGNDAGKMRGQR